MKHLLLALSLLLSTSLYGQIGPDGTGTVYGYYIGPYIDIGWSNADLAAADLSGANLAGARLGGVNFSGALLSNANLAGADLAGADFTNADLAGADLAGAYLGGADLSDTNLTGANLAGVKSGNIIGTPSLPPGYQIVNGYIVGPGVGLINARVQYSDLSGADLSNTNLLSANLAYSDLSGADFTNASLYDANLIGANLTNADLSGANLFGADFTNADLTGAIISSTTTFSTDLNMNWFSSQGAIVPTGTIITNNYTLETYSSTDLENWTLIKSETIESSEDILFLKSRVVEAE